MIVVNCECAYERLEKCTVKWQATKMCYLECSGDCFTHRFRDKEVARLHGMFFKQKDESYQNLGNMCSTDQCIAKLSDSIKGSIHQCFEFEIRKSSEFRAQSTRELE